MRAPEGDREGGRRAVRAGTGRVGSQAVTHSLPLPARQSLEHKFHDRALGQGRATQPLNLMSGSGRASRDKPNVR
jgi:hypothetical protein